MLPYHIRHAPVEIDCLNSQAKEIYLCLKENFGQIQILKGKNIPDDNYGSEGDIYLNTETNIFYYKIDPGILSSRRCSNSVWKKIEPKHSIKQILDNV